MLHLLPDAVEKYNALLALTAQASSSPPHHYPLVYLLATLGCLMVWCVDLLNLGSSERLMAVAAAARGEGGASISRKYMAPVTAYGWTKLQTTSESTRLLSHSGSMPLPKLNLPRAKPQLKHCLSCDSCEATQHSGGYNEDVLRKCSTILPHSHVDAHTTSQHVVFTGESSMLPFVLAAVFSIHSLLAGFALGANTSMDHTAIVTLVAILSHKFIEAASVGAHFAKERVALSTSIPVILLYSLMTPMGIVLGMVLTSTLMGIQVRWVEVIALSLGAGSFLYLAFHEMTEADQGEEEEEDMTMCSPLVKISMFGLGLGTMAALAVWV